MTIPDGLKDWRTTVIGIAQAVNAAVMAIQALQAEHAGVVFIEPKLWVRFLIIAGVLNAIKGVITPSTAKVKEKTSEMVDEKIDQKLAQ